MFKRQAPSHVSKTLDEEMHTSSHVRDLEAPLLERAMSNTSVTSSSSSNSRSNQEESSEGNGFNKVIDAKCNLMSQSYFVGILFGIVLQAISFYASNWIKSAPMGSTIVAFVLYVFTKYWMPVALLLPAAIVAMRSRSLPGYLRLESFFESLRFQFGLFFGSLLLLSLVNFYALANTAPLPLLLAYYAVCLTVSFVAMCLLQIFVNEVCANITSIEVIVNYEDNNNKHKKTNSSNDM